MSAELTALMRHHTWDLVPPPLHCNPVGCKWVFRVKRKSDGSIDRFKARLVAKGFHQRPGLDYKKTFSLVVKPATIRTVLIIYVMQGWSLRQLDVNNAFLRGKLHEIVYMIQPPGFKYLSYPNYVCRLQKTIYGLKQAPREWYSALKKKIMALGFTNSKADNFLFIYKTAFVLCFLLVYVYDLVITGNDNTFVSSIVAQFGVAFSLTDMGLFIFSSAWKSFQPQMTFSCLSTNTYMTFSVRQTCLVLKRCPLHCPPQQLFNSLMALPLWTAQNSGVSLVAFSTFLLHVLTYHLRSINVTIHAQTHCYTLDSGKETSTLFEAYHLSWHPYLKKFTLAPHDLHRC
jgi:hypothetical protein